MDVLVAGQGGELLDPGLHVVAGDPLPRLDAGQVDLVDHRLVVVDDLVGDVDARGRAGLAGPPPTAAARAPPCAPATRGRPSARWRSGRPARWAGARRASPASLPPGAARSGNSRWPRDADVGRSAPIGLRGSSRRRHATVIKWTARHGAGDRRASSDAGQLRQAPAREGRRPLPTVRRRLVQHLPRLRLRPKKPPFCMSCAMVAGGVRTAASPPGDAPQAAQGPDEGRSRPRPRPTPRPSQATASPSPRRPSRRRPTAVEVEPPALRGSTDWADPVVGGPRSPPLARRLSQRRRYPAISTRWSASCRARSASVMASICTTSSAAFLAPSMATVATGMPLGICTVA